MLKINPFFTKSTYNSNSQRVQTNVSDFYMSLPAMKKPLNTDIFEINQDSEKSSLQQPALQLPFLGNKPKHLGKNEQIAANLKEVLKGYIGGVSAEPFEKEYNKITEKNVIPVIKAYNKISPKETLIGAICKESADPYQARINAVNGITDKLVGLGKKAGVQTEHYKKYFDEELKYQYETLLPVKAQQLDKISGALIQAIENKNGLTQDERNEIKHADIKDTQTYTTSILNKSVKKAKDSMTEQENYDGWSAKLGEQIRKLWNSENQKELVHDDIEIFDNQVKELDKLVGTKEYNKKFKEIFDVDYDPELIATFKQKEEKYITAAILTGVENNFKKTAKDLLAGKPLADKYGTSYTTGSVPYLKETKESIYSRNFSAFAEFLGKGNIENGKNQIEKTMKEYKITKNSTLSEKYSVLQKMAQRYEKRLHQNTLNATGNKKLREMKSEYDNSYYAAFGVKNDIAKRVEDYRNSQMWSELLVQDTLLCAASIPIWTCTAGTGIIPTLKIAAMHSAADGIVYGSDRLSSKQGMKKEDIKEILKWAAVDGATAIANQLSYKGIEAITSPVAKISGKAAKATNFALSTIADVAIDCGFEKVATGKITLQGVVYSVVFSAGGYIIDLKVDDVQRKTL